MRSRIKEILKEVARIYDPQVAYRAGKYVLDNEKGAGATGFGRFASKDYGFMIMMKPDQYLRLTPMIGKERKENSILHFKEDPVIASPWLQVEYVDKLNIWAVTGHEGRHRATAMMHDQPNIEIPIQLIQYYNKLPAGAITPDMTKLPILSQEYQSEFQNWKDLNKMIEKGMERLEEAKKELAEIEPKMKELIDKATGEDFSIVGNEEKWNVIRDAQRDLNRDDMEDWMKSHFEFEKERAKREWERIKYDDMFNYEQYQFDTPLRNLAIDASWIIERIEELQQEIERYSVIMMKWENLILQNAKPVDGIRYLRGKRI